MTVCFVSFEEKKKFTFKFNGDLRKTISKKKCRERQESKKKICEERRNLSFILTDYTFLEEGHAECQSYEKVPSHMHVCLQCFNCPKYWYEYLLEETI